MSVVPAATPLTTPDVGATVAMLTEVEVHMPPLVASISAVIAPAHKGIVPATLGAEGNGFTVTIAVLLQPVAGIAYVITDVPGVNPITTPVVLVVAIVALPLLHTPPVLRSYRPIVAPAHSENVPTMAEGNGFVVTIVLILQPVAEAIYVITEVPGDAPVTVPDAEPMVAIAVLLLLQAPAPSRNTVVAPTHTLVMPLIAAGKGLTVTVVPIAHPDPIE